MNPGRLLDRVLRHYGLYLAWVVALVATGGSLYFSEVLGFIPCELCWWQRILMYPQALILGIASYRDDPRIVTYALPMSLIGASISAFHYVQEKVPGLRAPICGGDVSCFTPWINWFGFITIPFLALTAFLLISLCLWRAAARDGE
ncbi:MAG TPA: disulfide oxidoreductase [Thermaerobacter sp.]